MARRYWAPYALVSTPEDVRLFAEGGRPRFLFTADRFQRAVAEKEFVNEKLVNRVWDALIWDALDAEAQALVPPVVLCRKPEAPETAVFTPQRVFKLLRSIQAKDNGRGSRDFVNAFVGMANHVFTVACGADDLLLACEVPEGVGKSNSTDNEAATQNLKVILISQDSQGNWFVAVQRGNERCALSLGRNVSTDADAQLQKCLEDLKVHHSRPNTNECTNATYGQSQPFDSCVRACAAAWTVACFRDEPFWDVWTQAQWDGDAFVAGSVPANEAARMALAHAVVGCSSSVSKALAARKFLAAAVDVERKARRLKMAAADEVKDARRLNMVTQLDEADARRMALAAAPDTFPSERYPYNSARHLFLWTPALDPRTLAKTS